MVVGDMIERYIVPLHTSVAGWHFKLRTASSESYYFLWE